MAEPWYILESRRKDCTTRPSIAGTIPAGRGSMNTANSAGPGLAPSRRTCTAGIMSLRAKAGSARTAWNSFRTCLAGPSRKPRMTRNKIMPVNAAPVGTRGLFLGLAGRGIMEKKGGDRHGTRKRGLPHPHGPGWGKLESGHPAARKRAG